MALTECGNGHAYDTDQYTVCPWCNGGGNIIRFDVEESDNGSRTVAPDGFGGGTGRTVAPSAQSEAGGYAEELGKTVAPEGYRKKAEQEGRTIGVFKRRYNMEPVVGWLVCVEGTEKGKDFHLLARINTIGRSESNDVCLSGDLTVSKEQHARLAYDSRHNLFQLIPGTSTNNIYLNDEPIYIPAKLNAYDLIELGESKLVFIPFCSDRFRWETGLKQG